MRPPRVQPAPPVPDPSVPGKKHKTKKQEKQPPVFDLQQAVSATECTGLLAAQVLTDEEAESISALEGIHPIRPTEQ